MYLSAVNSKLTEDTESLKYVKGQVLKLVWSQRVCKTDKKLMFFDTRGRLPLASLDNNKTYYYLKTADIENNDSVPIDSTIKILLTIVTIMNRKYRELWIDLYQGHMSVLMTSLYKNELVVCMLIRNANQAIHLVFIDRKSFKLKKLMK